MPTRSRIRTLGPRIVEIHLKDFNFDWANGRFTWKNLGEGDIDWPEVRRALQDVGYSGYVTMSLRPATAYFKDVSSRVDRFLAGQNPVGEQWPFTGQRRLQHRPRVADVVDLAGEPAAARILIRILPCSRSMSMARGCSG